MKRESTYHKILNAAYELFSEKGYEATGISMIVERAGVSKGALYHYFKSKEELLFSVFEMVLSEALKENTLKIPFQEDPKKALLDMGYHMIAYTKNDRYYKHFLIEVMVLATKNERLKARFLSYLIEYKKNIEELLKNGLKGTNKDPKILSEGIVMMLDAIGLYLAMEDIDFDYKEIWKEFIEGIFRG